MKKSTVYKFRGRLFRYDYDCSVVELVSKASQEELDDNKRWQSKYGRNLWDIDENGYIVVDEIGLHKSNWMDKFARNDYLNEWVDELNYMAQTYSESYLRQFA